MWPLDMIEIRILSIRSFCPTITSEMLSLKDSTKVIFVGFLSSVYLIHFSSSIFLILCFVSNSVSAKGTKNPLLFLIFKEPCKSNTFLRLLRQLSQ